MSEETPLELHSVNVVVTAEFHNPSILNPDFLRSCGIVPGDWTPTETLTTPPLSVVEYDNGLHLTVDQTRLTVTGPAVTDSEASGNANPIPFAFQVARAYLAKLPYVPYRYLGLNCRVSARKAEPGRWLLEHFGAPWLRDEANVQGMRPKFSLLADGAVCNISLSDVEEEKGGRVVADCNLHHAGPLAVEAMRAAIERWPDRQAFVLLSVNKLLGGSQK